MKAGTARNVRSPRGSTETHAFWRAAGLILLFNGLLAAWVLLDPYGERISAIVLNAAGFVGPLLVLPLCFGGLLGWMRRGGTRTGEQTAGMTGQRWGPGPLGMGIPFYGFWEKGLTYYYLGLRPAPPL